eukprot:1620097-Amphidinium_carterae.1
METIAVANLPAHVAMGVHTFRSLMEPWASRQALCARCATTSPEDQWHPWCPQMRRDRIH